MTTDEIGLLDGPEMDALRELRADVPGPTDAQRQAAWERMQGARSQADMSQEGLPAYPMDGITFERSGGAGSPVTAVVIDHVPTEPVDINFTQ